MKSPITGKEMRVSQEWRDMNYRNEKFPVLFIFFLCEESGEKFEDEHFAELNYNSVVGEYRAKHDTLFTEQL
ncbi:MAG: hypothetical protein M0R39_11145 [Prolixibacteraceae bacterium]|nr:hypothetical protein [Prolixibacteraceae bacterium]